MRRYGIRVENRFDGTPGLTQAPIQPGESFRYVVAVPDDGIFWYHPHIRTDVQPDLGLYGNIVVLPADAPLPSEPPSALILDDILLSEDGSLAPYGKESENFSLMGRFGNTHLVNGAVQPELRVRIGRQRLYLTNAANTRTYRVSIEDAEMTLAGGDIGFGAPREIDEAIVSPGERAIIDVMFSAPGTYALLHRSTGSSIALATLLASDPAPAPATARAAAGIPDLETHQKRKPDHTLRMSHDGGHRHGQLTDMGIEWEDAMPEQNAASHRGNTRWRFVDDDTGDINMQIQWRFHRGDLVKIRLKNDYESMQHPIHFHGQRFVVMTSDGVDVIDAQWKDTYLLKSGETADILLEASNPGHWMVHCHITEHAENGMMSAFVVE